MCAATHEHLVTLDAQNIRAPWPLFELRDKRVLEVRNRSPDGLIIKPGIVISPTAEPGHFARFCGGFTRASSGKENVARARIRQTDFHLGAGELFFGGTEKPRGPGGYPSKFGNGAQDKGINSDGAL